MPDGVLQWFDERSGQGVVVRAGRSYVAKAADVEASARRTGARVHFDVVRDDGVERAVDVVLRRGTRTGDHHGRVGTLVGERRPDDKATAAYRQVHPEAHGVDPEHPVEVARAFADAVRRGEADAAAALCSPDLRLHLAGHDLVGRRQLDGWLAQHPALGCRQQVVLRGADGDVEVRWSRSDPGALLPGLRCRVANGLIVEAWSLPPRRATVEVALATGSGLRIETVIGPGVGPGEVRYAEEHLARAAEHVAEVVLFARLKLSMATDPARSRPARAEVLLDLNGDPVRAAVAARSVSEAVDLLAERLRDQLRHRAERREALHRSSGRAAPGAWRHGALVAPHPEHFDRPVEERQLVRVRSLAPAPRVPEEALADMEQLDYDFYLFCDLETGRDALVERDPEGHVRLSRVGGGGAAAAEAGLVGGAAPGTAPRHSLQEAIEYLNLTGAPHVFFEDADTGRGNVCYLRYDGHYGLISLE